MGKCHIDDFLPNDPEAAERELERRLNTTNEHNWAMLGPPDQDPNWLAGQRRIRIRENRRAAYKKRKLATAQQQKETPSV